MFEAGPLRVVWSHLLAASLGAVVGCSDPSQAGADAADAPATKPATENVPSPAGPENAAATTEPAPRTGSECAPEVESAYPIDAPAYPAGVVLENCRASDGRIRRVTTTHDTGERVYLYMTRALAAQGWAIQSRLAQSGQFALDATLANRRAAVLIADRDIIEPRDGLTRITVLVTP